MSELNLELMLKPISEKNPVGNDLRDNDSPTALYYQIKEMRAQARNCERNIDQEEDPNRYWQKVYDFSIQAITKDSKDLEVVAWLIEAAVRLYGLKGLAGCFNLLTELIDRYWESAHPVGEQAKGYRLSAFSGLNGIDREGALIQPILSVFITSQSVERPVKMWEYIHALELNKIKDQQLLAKKKEEGFLLVDDIIRRAHDSGEEFYHSLMSQLNESMNNFTNLVNKMDEKCGEEIPATSQIKNVLEQFKEHLNFLLSETNYSLTKNEINQDAIIKNDIAGNHGNSQQEENLTRAIALKKLKEISTYFKQAEPHSPIPYLLERAIHWGGLPFPDLLVEMIQDEGARAYAMKLSGINNSN